MTKYAVLFLGLLVGQAYAYDDCDNWECQKARSYRQAAAIRAEMQASEQEDRAAFERSRTIQVITPNDSFLAYPSADGRTVQIYDRLGRE